MRREADETGMEGFLGLARLRNRDHAYGFHSPIGVKSKDTHSQCLQFHRLRIAEPVYTAERLSISGIANCIGPQPQTRRCPRRLETGTGRRRADKAIDRRLPEKNCH